MQRELLNLDFGRWEIIFLSLLPACLNLLIFLYAYLVLDRTRTTTFFAIFVLFLGLWQTSEGFMRLSQSEETAIAWQKKSELFILISVLFGIQFILCLTGWFKKKCSRLISLIIFLPVIAFSILIIEGLEEFNMLKSDTVFWIANPKPTLVTLSILTWISLGGITMLLMLWHHFIKTKGEGLKNKQALLLAIGVTIPVIGGILCEILFPLLFKLDDIPVTGFMVTIFSITSLIAINKYKLLEYTPRHQWEQIVETMSEGLLIADNENRIQYANESFCRVLGYEFNEIRGKKAKDLFLEDKYMEDAERIRKEWKEKNGGQYEIPLKAKNGDAIWMLISGSPYLDRKGNEIGTISVQTNITHLKDAEKKLAYNELRLKQAQEVAHVGSWELNFASGKCSWSDETCRIYGISTDEKSNQTLESWLSFIHPEELESVKKEIVRNRAAAKNSSIKHRIVRKDGTIRHIHTESRYEFNRAGYPIGLFGVSDDITEHVEGEWALMESEKNMRTFIDESLMSIHFIDPKTKKTLYSNPALSELLGYTRDELKSISIYDFVNHSRENIDEKANEVMQKQKINYGEREWKRKDGTMVNVLVSSFYHKRNGTDAIYVSAQDITERKRAEEKLKNTNDELKTFIYKASHDIRGPLASILGLVNVSKLELKEEASIRYLDMIYGATKKLDYTLGELVKAMQIKDVDMFTDQIDFDELVKDILKRFDHFPGFENLKVSIGITPIESYFSNKVVIETIIQNLIENAIKYQRNSGNEPFLKIEITGNREEVRIAIEDNGSGIQREIQDKIFDMYFRGNSTAKGSGLGLYLVKKAIDKLSGKIDLQSELRKGSRFTVILPGHNLKST